MYGATAGEYISDGHEKSEGLMGIESDLQTLTRKVACMGTTSSDSLTLREEVRDLRCQLKRKISEEHVRVAGLLEQPNGDRSKVSEDCYRDSHGLGECVRRLHQLMQEEMRLLQRFPSPNMASVLVADGGGDDVDGDGALPLLHTQALSDRTTQTEREAAAMEEINRDIGDLHEIQAAVARMVQRQGNDIDVIEANVGVAHAKVLRGRRALGEAAVFKSSSRRKKCCIIIFVSVAVSIPTVLLLILIVLVVYFLVLM